MNIELYTTMIKDRNGDWAEWKFHGGFYEGVTEELEVLGNQEVMVKTETVNRKGKVLSTSTKVVR